VGRPARAHLRLVASNPSAKIAPLVDDAELLASTVEGQRDAAAALHDRLRPCIERTVRRLLGPRDPDIDDCVQNAFVEIVRSVDRYRGECALEHWASRVAAHIVYKHIRRRRIERKVFEADADASVIVGEAAPGRRLAMRSLLARVREKLAALDAKKTYAFLLHDVLGFDLKEVAHIEGTSVAAAQKRLVRGRREVHAELASDPEIAEALLAAAEDDS
jgi:RNA polymerase sigma-70 factor (ECF subfamily)